MNAEMKETTANNSVCFSNWQNQQFEESPHPTACAK